MRRYAVIAVTSLVSAGALSNAVAGELDESATRTVRLEAVGGFHQPLYVTSPPADPDGLFVVERAGRVIVLRGGKRRSQPFLDISSRVSTGIERGLLSLAFAPDYETSGRFYVCYSDRRGHVRVDEFRRSEASADRADGRTRRSVLVVRHPRAQHFGGQLAFGADGLLYVSLGDGGGKGDPNRNAQDLGSLLGKVLRIDPSPSGKRPYGIPSSNPFKGRHGARPEVYAYGLRNPFRMSFDRATGDLAIADVGQDAVEEIDFARRGHARGANYGWSVFEGRRRYRAGRARGHDPPVLERAHARGWCAIIGGFVVRDPALTRLRGRYVYADFCRRELHSVVLREGRARDDRELDVGVTRVSSFGEDAKGRVYVTSLRGRVYRLAPP